MSRVPKRIYCFRKMNLAGELVDVSSELVDISDALSIGESEIPLFEYVVRIQRFKGTPVGRLYHLTRYSPGTQRSTLNAQSTRQARHRGQLRRSCR